MTTPATRAWTTAILVAATLVLTSCAEVAQYAHGPMTPARSAASSVAAVPQATSAALKAREAAGGEQALIVIPKDWRTRAPFAERFPVISSSDGTTPHVIDLAAMRFRTDDLVTTSAAGQRFYAMPNLSTFPQQLDRQAFAVSTDDYFIVQAKTAGDQAALRRWLEGEGIPIIDYLPELAYAGLVPFTVTGARPVLLPPVPLVSNFHEVNVRTYVHRNGRDPGVWFFSLDASSRVAVEAARAMYKLSYFSAEIAFAASDEPLPRISFQATRTDERSVSPAHAHLVYGPENGVTTTAVPGSLEHFLIERYVLYATDSGHQLYRARIHHQPYPVQKAEVVQLDETLLWAAGIRRSENVPIRHYAREVNVKVYPLEKV